MRETEMDVVYRVLDSQLLDVEGRRCGRVDDLQFEGGVGEPTHLAAILSGHGTWSTRLPRRLRRLGRRVFGEPVWGSNARRVPWDQVDDVDAAVELKGRAADLGLAEGDVKLAQVIERAQGG
jgi:sporulation protein YlmC with PRC-barrel domain